MDVRCERCRAQYVFDDEQVTPAGLAVQCTNCGHVFKVKKKELVVTVPVKPGELEAAPLPATAAAPRAPGVAAPAASAPAAPAQASPAPEPPREWRVRQANGNIFAFRELTTLQKWIIEQKVSRDDEISLSGDQWKRLGNIAELASFFQVVEAAERGKAQAAAPAVTPVPIPVPVYGVALSGPQGYPATPHAPSYTTTAPLPLGAERRAEAPSGPTVEVDLGPEELARGGTGRGGRALLALLALAAAGAAGAWFLAPELLGRRGPPADAVAAAPAPAVAAAAEQKPAVEPEPPAAPAAAPVPAPERIAEAPVAPPPEPIVKPAESPAPPPPRGPKALLAEAARLRGRGQVERALDLYGRVAADQPENVEALTGRGLCYLDLERFPPAEASFQAALGLEPDDPDALLGLAETYRWQGRTADAIRYYDRYLARHPDGDEADVARNALEQLRN